MNETEGNTYRWGVINCRDAACSVKIIHHTSNITHKHLHISLEMSIFVVDERDIAKQCITPESLAGQNIRMMSTENSDYSIKQNGVTILSGDEISMKMIFRNLTGENFKGEPEAYCQYKRMVKSQGFDLKRGFRLYHNDEFLAAGKFQTALP